MYTPGKLIYFDPFYFKDGSESKPKYFLVLKVINGNVVLASLPSSKIHLPQAQEIIHGCLEMPDSGINCYIFKANTPVTKCGWSFKIDTLLYGNWLDDFNIELLSQNYSIEGVDYEIIGELADDQFRQLINCFSTSRVVKRKYKRWLLS
ncbi:hypothetical protein [Foetidibacter luteolus]|uniref:hypothetical protein n=1 Tax=Foetidibacter luteolus TaxID=2608880 RepID=UPI00129B725C|nr:hypothetical protein [Foetidibacter luteolus]